MPAQPLLTVTGSPLHGVGYFCTTRHGGVSTGPWASMNLGLHTADNPEHVKLNRQRLQALLPAQTIWLNQVHGTDVFDADSILGQQPELADGIPTADAAITTQPGKALVIMTADCLPVVIASSDGTAIGVAHAGWRGLAAGVLENTLQALQRKVIGDITWHAWIGPAISQACFEVGHDVFTAFTESDPTTAAYFVQKTPALKWLADLPGLAQHRLQQAGVTAVQRSDLCTYSQPQMFYSYRREPTTGRLSTVAWLIPR